MPSVSWLFIVLILFFNFSIDDAHKIRIIYLCKMQKREETFVSSFISLLLFSKNKCCCDTQNNNFNRIH